MLPERVKERVHDAVEGIGEGTVQVEYDGPYQAWGIGPRLINLPDPGD